MLATPDATDENDLNRRIQEASKSKALDLSGLRLTYALPPGVSNIKYLRSINLYKNFLETIPEDVLRFETLEEINLYRNRFSRIPRTITQLSNLRVLNLGSNALEVLSPHLFEVATLEELDLSNNQIRSIPPSISLLTNLRDLKVSRNRLKSLPGEIGDLKLLRKLDLAFNQVVNLPSNFGKLTALATLNVSENPLRSPPIAVVKRGRQAIVQYLQQDSTDASKSRADGAGLKGSIIGLTANFTIFSCNLQGRDRLAGGDNFVVRITRAGVTPGSVQLEEPTLPTQGSTSQGNASDLSPRTVNTESSDTDGVNTASIVSVAPAAPTSDSEEARPKAPATGTAPEEVPAVEHMPVVDTTVKSRKGRSSTSASPSTKSKSIDKQKKSAIARVKASKKRQAQSEPASPLLAPSMADGDAEDMAESAEEADEARTNKLVLAVQQSKDEFLAAVVDNYNGTYSVTYTPMFEGDYTMSVMLQGTHIEGSPFSIVVEPDLRDKAKNLEQQLGDEQKKREEEGQRLAQEAEVRQQLEKEVQRLKTELQVTKQELDRYRRESETRATEIERLEKENADLRAALKSPLKKHKKEGSSSIDDEHRNSAGSELEAGVTKSKSGKLAKSKKAAGRQESLNSDTSQSETPRESPATAAAQPAGGTSSKKNRQSLNPAVATALATASQVDAGETKQVKSPNHEAKQKRRSRGVADATLILQTQQQDAEDEIAGDSKRPASPMNRSNSVPLNERPAVTTAAPSLTTANSQKQLGSRDVRKSGEENAVPEKREVQSDSSGTGEIESRSISYKLSLAFWKIFDKDKGEKKEAQHQEKEREKDKDRDDPPKSARGSSKASSKSKKEEHSPPPSARGDDAKKEDDATPKDSRKSKHKGK